MIAFKSEICMFKFIYMLHVTLPEVKNSFSRLFLLRIVLVIIPRYTKLIKTQL